MTSQWVYVIPELYLHTNNVIIQTSDKHIVHYKIDSHYKAPDHLNNLCSGWKKIGWERVKAYLEKRK